MKQTVQELHKQHNINDSPIDLYLVHKFDSTFNTWKFTGYRCIKCNSSFKNVSTIYRHGDSCRGLKVTRSYGADNPELVINSKGQVWQPYSKTP